MEKKLNLNKSGIKLVNVLLCMIYLAPILLAINPSFTTISSIIIIGFSIILWGSNKFYYIFPIFILFSGELLLPGDISTYRVFSLLLFFKIIFSKKLTIEKAILFPFSIIILYCFLVIALHDYTLSFLIIFDLLLIIMYISTFIRNNITQFFTYYVFATVSSCVYGWFMQTLNIKTFINIDNEWVQVSRFVGSFPDPNYFGFFINIAIFVVIILNIFKNKSVKIPILIFLYVSLLSTLSITGFICNVLMLGVYFALSKKAKIKYILTVLAIGALLFLNLDFLASANYPAISDAAKRITSQLSIGTDKDTSALTTGRSDIWKEHLEYYLQQPITKILFGGNYVTDAGMDPKFKNVSHQAYIDMLLNFGLLGTLVMILFIIIITLKYVSSYFKTKNEEYLLLVIIKIIWVFYAFGLSMFPSWKFNLFFFL